MVNIFKTALSGLCLSAACSAKPIHRSSSLDERFLEFCPPTNETKTIWMPETWNIYPQQPNLSRDEVSGFEVETVNGKSVLEQVIVFRGLPKKAKSCTLGWSQADRTDRIFLVDGESALVKVRPLSGFPARTKPVTYAAVKHFDDPSDEKELHPDFTFWDANDDAAPHIAGQVDCAEEMYFRVSLEDPTVNSHVYLNSNEENGFWLEFSC